MNIDIWVVNILNQLKTKFSHKKRKTKHIPWKSE